MNPPFITLGLDALPVGAEAVVREIGGEPAFRLRLMELGLVPGTRVRCVGRSPLGDPLRYAVRDAELGLRRLDARVVRVERV